MPVDELERKVADRLAELLPASQRRPKVHPAHKRLDWQSSSNSVNVIHGPRVMSVAGVTPGSITEDPAGTVTDQPNASEPRYRRLAWECAAQKHAEPDGYSGWLAVFR